MSALPPRRVTWLGLPRLLLRTIRADRQTHVDRTLPVGAATVVRLVRPKLDRPVFVIGATRSGTTFLGDCLAQAPVLSYHFEPILTKASARYVYLGLWPEWKSRLVYRATFAWLSRVSLEPDIVFVEKNPVDCFVIPFLARTFPGARFVHILRDGRDAALSHSKRPWLRADSAGSGRYEPGGYPYGPTARYWVEPERAREFETTTDYHRCIWAWRRYVEETVAGFEHVDASRRCDLRYEQIAADPRAAAVRVLDFLAIDDAASRDAVIEAMGAMHDSSIGRWRDEVSAADQELALREAGPLLASLGYD